MRHIRPSVPTRFTDAAANEIMEALRPSAIPERLQLLPEILAAWSERGLLDLLSLDDRETHRARAEQLQLVSEAATNLIRVVRKLDERGRFEIACRARLHAQGFLEERWDLAIARGAPEIIIAAERHRDEVLSWLANLTKALSVPEPKPPPGKRTRSYLVVLDLAAVFEFVTGKRPTRHNTHYQGTSQRLTGPFWKFVCCVCRSIPEVKSLDRAVRDVLKYYYPGPEDSAWFANTYSRL
jgi:hypothetical protein